MARLAPEVGRALPDLPEPESLQPDEERFRLLDAVSQLLIAASRRTPLVLVLDDLHWADKGTIAMLRHVARFAKQNRMLLVGSYRDVELDRQHPLSDALSAMRREAEYERILLRGLNTAEVGGLPETIAEHDVNQALVDAISAQTEGNPFFIREVLMHLVEEGKLFYQDGRWRSKATSIADLGIPEGVRQVIGRRLSRLSPDANSLLQAAAAFNSVFRFEVVSELADLEEKRALDALDEALEAQLLRPAGDSASFDFTHALVQQTLYTELSPPRQVRLHRGAAEAIEHLFGDRTADWAADLAYQYHRSSVLPGADRGVDYALTAADRAQSHYAWEEVVGLLRMAADLLLEGDSRRSRILGRLGIALAWSREPEESVRIALNATELIALGEGDSQAADYAWEPMLALGEAGFQRAAWTLADAGMNHIGDRRDHVWAALRGLQLAGLEARNPDGPGIPILTPEYAEVEKVLEGLPRGVRIPSTIFTFGARRTRPDGPGLADLSEATIKAREAAADRFEARGGLATALTHWSNVARAYIARGDIAAAHEPLSRAQALAERLPGAASAVTNLSAVYDELALATDSGHEAMVGTIDRFLATDSPENVWLLAPIRAAGMRAHARIGDEVEALRLLETLIAPLELAPGGAPNYTRLACDVATGLWWLGSTDHLDVVERSIREKVVEPDFRYPMQDGRLSLARLCALTGRYDEARDWFQRARNYLEEQGARPLRAITDFDEGSMCLRWPRAGDRKGARPLLEAALVQFKEIGMSGWVTRAEELLSSSALPTRRQAPEYPDGLSEREVEVLRLIAAARTNQQIADELVISLNTVERHVNHILTKTGAANRVELALFAQRSGLLG